MLKKVITFVILTSLIICVPIYAESKITVKLPNFSVVLNGSKVNTAYSQYPPIVYKDVTYLPMTFNDCRNLGLETKWSIEDGLAIEKTGIFAEYNGSVNKTKNASTHQASIPSFKITVNGKIIDNSKEKYPFLTFRNVTYLPLTWHFTVEEFGWKETYDVKSGLVVSSERGNVKQIEIAEAVKTYADFKLIDGYYYFGGKKGENPCVFRAPSDNPKDTTIVYEIKDWQNNYSEYPILGFFKMDGVVYFSYHEGGATMGHDVYCRVTPEGLGEEVISGYLDFRMVGSEKVFVNYFVPPGAGNLFYAKNGQEDRQPIGTPEYLYGWIHSSENGTLQTFTPSRSMMVRDGWIYITASKYETYGSGNLIWKVNYKTKEMLPVSHIPLKAYSIVDDTIYSLGETDSLLYSTSLNGEPEKKIVNVPISGFAVTKDVVWYIASDNQELYRQDKGGKIQAVMPGVKVGDVWVENGYVLANLSVGEDNGLAVFNNDKSLLFKTSDGVISTSVDGTTLVYRTSESGNIYSVNLQ